MSRFVPAALGVLLLAALSAPAAEPKPLRRELTEVASALNKYLRNRATSVTVDAFSCASKPPSNHGPGIALVLGEELTRAGLKVAADARFQVKGSYKVILDASLPVKQLAIKLEVRLEERGGGTGLELDIARAVVDEETVAGALGLTVALPPGGDEKARNDVLVAAIKQEQAPPPVEDSRIRAAQGSPFAVEIVVKRGDAFEPVKPRLEDKAPFAPLTRDDVYAVRLINDADHEAAATLTIDGLDLFAFSGLKVAALIVPPKGTALVRGWPTSLTTANAFKITSYAEGAAAQLKSPAPVGVINVAFAAAWPKGKEPPADEPKRPTRGAKGGDATGHGAPVGDRYNAVEREVGVLRASISVRYTK